MGQDHAGADLSAVMVGNAVERRDRRHSHAIKGHPWRVMQVIAGLAANVAGLVGSAPDTGSAPKRHHSGAGGSDRVGAAKITFG